MATVMEGRQRVARPLGEASERWMHPPSKVPEIRVETAQQTIRRLVFFRFSGIILLNK
jgi:hypothetical protein